MKTSIIRPMLACSHNVTVEDLQSLQMPIYVSIKQDGIRCRLDRHHGLISPMSRALKELPNMYIQEWAREYGIEGLDGEIVIPGLSFHEIQSWVMTAYPMENRPFEFRVFDCMSENHSWEFEARLEWIYEQETKFDKRTKIVQQTFCKTPLQIKRLFEKAISEGEEGLILRSPSGLYKSGRSTWSEAFSLKMKAFEDDEAVIVGFFMLETNQNPKTESELGLSKRSSHHANKTAIPTLGGFTVRHPKWGGFAIGSGFTSLQRLLFWNQRQVLLDRQITFKYQAHGTKDKPRTPIFKSLNP